MSTAAETLWKVEDLAAYLNSKPGTIYKQVHEGRIPYLKLGNAVRFRKSEIDAHLQAHRAARQPQPQFQTRFQSARASLRSLKTELTENTPNLERKRG